jgi:putative aldouronate transport system substrate-binding protein
VECVPSCLKEEIMTRKTATPPSGRRRTTVLALGVLPLLALTACTPGAEGEEGGDAAGTLQVLVLKHPLTKPMKEMAWVGELEERAGVKIEWEEVSADWDQKKSTMFAAGDVPDLIIGTNAVTNSDIATFQGLFEDLSDDLNAMPNVKEFLETKDEARAIATQPDGAIYSIGGYKRFWPETVTHQYINQQWLDNLGLEVPTTWDELYDVLVAFKEQDANGNGDPNDEIPWDWAPAGTGGFGYFQPTVLLGSLGLPLAGGGGAGYFVEDGKVGNFLIDERYKEVVAFLHRCYQAGLISEEVMTQDYSAYQSVARGDGDTAKVGFSWGWTASDRFGAQLAPQYAATAPLLAEEGQSEPVVWTYDSYGENFPANQVAMAASSDNKEAALKVIDAFYDQEMSVQVLFGDLGKNVQKDGEGSYTVLPPADGKSDPSTWKWTSTLADNGPQWIRDDIEVVLPSDLQEAVDQAEPLEEALSNMDLEQDVYPGQFVKMSQEDLSTVALNNTNVLNLAMTKWAEWVTAGGVEEQWDGYVGQLEGLGLKQNVEIHQRYYDEYVSGS